MRFLKVASFRTTVSPCVRNDELPVDDIAVSVEETTVPTTSAIAVIWVEIAVIPASERMDETSDWIFWTNSAV